MENQNFINGNKNGNTITYSINGVLNKKAFATPELANEFFAALIDAKRNPTDENVSQLLALASNKAFLAKIDDFVFDPENDQVFLKGFEHTPVPDVIINVVEDYLKNDFDVTAIKNFWKLLMANPDKNVRRDLYKFINEHDFVITDEGYMVVYKAVYYKSDIREDLATFVSNSYLKVRKDWNTSAGKYVVYKEITGEDSDGNEVFEYKITKKSTFKNWDSKNNIELIGSLDELQENIDQLIDEENSTVFTDMRTQTMEIRLGEPVKMERKECDGDPKMDCSYGLHVGATKYVENFGNSNSPVLVCLVNPMHVVAVPEYDSSKMRVCEYYPMALGTYENRKIDIIQQSYFPYNYVAHEEEELNRLLETNEYDDMRCSALNAPTDERTEDEYAEILKARVVDLLTMSNEE